MRTPVKATTIRFQLLRAALALAAITFTLALSAQAQTFKVIHTFSGGSDGSEPFSGVLLDSAGNLYGATSEGGNLNSCKGVGCGVVYKLSPTTGGAWQETALIRFRSSATGGFPQGNLVLDGAGNVFGGAGTGGGSTNCANLGLQGCGLVFELTPHPNGWSESVPQTFDAGVGGGFPYGGLTADAAGNLYGTTFGGGDLSGCLGFGCGTVFRLSPAGTVWQRIVLYSFTGGADGAYPSAPLIFDAAGNAYSTASGGGINAKGCPSQNGCGVVYKLTPTASGPWTETVLHAFNGKGDGAYSFAGLVFDPAGNLYGMTYEGGNLNACEGLGCGSVFELSPTSGGTWKESALHIFSGKGDGAQSAAGLTFDAAGNLYGVAFSGGNLNACGGLGCGLVFKLSPTANGWKETAIHTFSGGQDGAGPTEPLTLDAAGNIYGTAAQGGAANQGVVFKITP